MSLLATQIKSGMPRRNRRKKKQPVKQWPVGPPIVWNDFSRGFRPCAAPVATPLELENEVSRFLPRVLSQLVGAKTREFHGDLVSVGTCSGSISLHFDDQTQRFLVVFREHEGWSKYRFLVGHIASPNELCEIYAGKTHKSLDHIRLFGDFVVFVDNARLEFISLSTRQHTVQHLSFQPSQLDVLQSRYVIVARKTCRVFDVANLEADEGFTHTLSLRAEELALSFGRLFLTVGDFIVTRNVKNSVVILRGLECEHWLEPEFRVGDIWTRRPLNAMNDNFLFCFETYHNASWKHQCLAVLRLSDRRIWTLDFDEHFAANVLKSSTNSWGAVCVIEDGLALAVSMFGKYFVYDLAAEKERASMQAPLVWAQSLVPWVDQTTVLVRTANVHDGFSLHIWDTFAMTMTPIGEKTPQWSTFENLCVGAEGTVIASAERTLLVFR